MMINIIGNAIGAGQSTANPAFIMEVDTTIAGALPDNQFELRVHAGQGYPYNYDLTTSDGQSFTGLTNNQTITFPAPGVYTLKITGTFPGTNYGGSNESKKIIDIKNWGAIEWRRALSAFQGCENLTTFSASDYPDFSLLDTNGMRQMFQSCTNLNADFSKWDVSTVATFDRAFNLCSSFNNDSVCNWDTSSSTAFNNCFASCTVFDQDLSNWDVSNATNFFDMFLNASAYNNGGQALTWTLGSGSISLGRVFGNTSFNQDISSWNTSTVGSMRSLFQGSDFNNPSINNWDTSSVTDMRYMFASSPFNQDISGWDVSNVTLVEFMFNGSFNQPIGSWTLSSCTNFNFMFYGCASFNQDLSAWDVSAVTSMAGMFQESGTALKTLNIGGWNTGNVQNLQSFCLSARITDDLSGWDVSSCTNFQTFVSFGKIFFDLSPWAVQGAVSLNNMIRDTYTDQIIVDQWDFSGWDISQCTTLGTQFALAETLTTANYDATLISWAAQAPVNALTAHFGNSQYTLGGAAEAARNTLINTYGWTIIDGGGI